MYKTYKSVRAKFKCIEVKKVLGGSYDSRGKFIPGPVHCYRFSAVVGNNAENETFFASTPSGTIELTAVRDDLFELGKEYYIDFTECVVPVMAVEAAAEEETK